MHKQITVTVNQAGEIQIEATGFKGNACEKATKALEDALGVAAKRKKKPEYHFTSGVSQQQTIG